ncbi:MAG: PAS domain S-box protein [Bacteroidetes bacterium]|nr:PAS domain S-box protein [Bacteroidota bacterium]
MKIKISFIILYIFMLLITSVFSLWSYKLYDYINKKQTEMNANSNLFDKNNSISQILPELFLIENEFGNEIEKDSAAVYWNKRFVGIKALVDSIKLNKIFIKQAELNISIIDSILNSINNEFQVLLKAETHDKITNLKTSITSDINLITELSAEIKNDIYEKRFLNSSELASKWKWLFYHLIASGLLVLLFFIVFINSRYVKAQMKKVSDWATFIETKVKYFYEQKPLMQFNIDADGKILYVNKKGAEFLGFSSNELVGKSIEKITSSNHVEVFRSHLKKLVKETGNVLNWELQRTNSKGKNLWVKETARSVKDKNRKRVVYIDSMDITESKITQDKITLSDLILQNVGSLIVVTDSRSSIKYISPSVYGILGYKPEELMGDGWWQNTWFVSGEMEKEKEESQKRASGKLEINKEPYERFVKSKSGSPTWILWQETKGPDDLLISVGHDITASKQVEKALKHSETRYSELFDSISDSIIISELGGKIIEANSSAFENLAYTKNELMNFTMWDIISDDFKANKEFILTEIKKNKFYLYESEHRTKDGKEIPVEISSRIIDYENKMAILSIARDITDRKKAEAQFKLLSTAIEQSPASVMITDTDGKITYVNPRFIEITGYSEEEVIGKTPRILKSGKTSQEKYEMLWKTILEGNTWYGEFYNKKKNDEYFWELASVSPIKNDKGSITNFIAVKEDITERKRTEVELRNAKEKAEEMSRLKSIFLNNMSHELRTPMIGIIGFAEILFDEIREKDLKEIAGNIYSGGKRLTRTLNSILDLSKVESNELELKIENIELNKLTKEITDQFNEIAVNKKISLLVTEEDKHIIASVDERLYSDIVKNLVDNSVKYTNKGGVIVELYYDYVKEKKYACLKVTDSGIGIPKESQQLIFEPFRQVSEGNNRSFEGCGLGLTITKKFVEVMHGRIGLSSKADTGTTFIVQFPAGN